MKKFIALLLAGFAVTLAQAEYVDPSLILISIYNQNVAPEKVSTQMDVVAYGDEIPFDSVAMTGPGGRVLGVPPTGFRYDLGDPSRLFLQSFAYDYYPSLADVPAGRYRFDFDGGAYDGLVVDFRLNPAFLPAKPPLFTAGSIHRLQFARSDRDIKVRFPAQKTKNNAVSESLTFIVYLTATRTQIYNSGPQPLDTKVWVIPANTLGNDDYTVTLDYEIEGKESHDDVSTTYSLISNYQFVRTAATAREIPGDD
jgi:hypothetical protein